MTDRGPQGPPEPPPTTEMMLRVHFDPAERRQGLVARLLELRTLIPQLEEEKARIEGMITLLDEISPPPQQMQPPGAGSAGSPGCDTEDGSNGKPKGK